MPQKGPLRTGEVPFVSVAIITYNKKNTIEQCLSALRAIDYPPDKYEIVVVDGGSTDGTLESIRKFPVTVILEGRKCRGIARNTALVNCKGQIIAFTDADCVPSRSWLRDHVFLHKDPKLMAVAGAVLRGGDPSLAAKIYHRTEFSALSPSLGRRETWEVATCNASFKRSVFTLVGPFPELDWSEDCLLCWRILQAGFNVIFDPGPRVVHLHEPMSFQSLLRKLWKQGYFDRNLQDAFGEHAPYRLPRAFLVTVLLFPSLVLARLARYFTKFLRGSSLKIEPLMFLPFLLAASLAWTTGYLVSAHGRS